MVKMLFQVSPCMAEHWGWYRGFRLTTSYKGALSTTQGPPSSPLSGAFAHVLGPGQEFYKEAEISCASPNAPPYKGKLEINNILTTTSPRIRVFHEVKVSPGSSLPRVQRAGPTGTVLARSAGSKFASLGVDLPCSCTSKLDIS